MALSKTFTLPELPDGVPASYIRYNRIEEMDRRRRLAVILFDLYVDQATADRPGSSPQRPSAFRLRASGADFDAWFSNEALAAAEVDVVAQAYRAARVLTVDWWERSAPLSDAEDV